MYSAFSLTHRGVGDISADVSIEKVKIPVMEFIWQINVLSVILMVLTLLMVCARHKIGDVNLSLLSLCVYVLCV